MFLKEEILPHYQSSRFFQIYPNSNKMSGPLHIWIMFELTDVYYIYLMLIILPSRCFPCKSFLRSSKRSSLGNYTSNNTRQNETTWVQQRKHDTTRDNTITIRHNTSKTRLNTSTTEARTAKNGALLRTFCY